MSLHCRYEYNFPPGLNLIHYNPWHGDNIPLACKKTASVVYFGFRLSVFALLANVGTNIAALAAGYAPAGDLVLSIFQFIILSLLASMAFYWYTTQLTPRAHSSSPQQQQSSAAFTVLHSPNTTLSALRVWCRHYRGIAGEIRREKQLYYGLEAVLCVVYVLLMSLDSKNVHGFAAFGAHGVQAGTVDSNGTIVVQGSNAEGAMYDIFAISEGSLWGLTLLFSLGGLWRVYRYRGHTISFAREQPVGAKTRHKRGRASALTNAL